MARKRSISDSKNSDTANELHTQKRIRMSPSTTTHSDSSVMSPRSATEISARDSTPDVVMRDQESSVSSVPSDGNADDSESSLESSDDSTSEEDDENDTDDAEGSQSDDVVDLGAPKKPKIDASVLSGASDLASRLKAFLPQLQQANSKLAEEGAGLSMEDVDDDEAHIEMSLGLGVLEQKQQEDLKDLVKRKAQADQEQYAESDRDDEETADEPDVLDRLVNMQRDIAKARQPSIQEVECRPDDDHAPSTAKKPSEGHHEKLSLRANGTSKPS